MNLYLVRHADALPLGTAGIATDEERPLSDHGFQQVARLAGGLRRLVIPFDQIVASPLRRAWQTGEELLRRLERPQLPLLNCEQLRPDGGSRNLAKYLRNLQGDHVILVGHEPDMSRHTAWLIGSKKARLEFAKAAVACIVCDRPPDKGVGTLLWLVTPEWLSM